MAPPTKRMLAVSSSDKKLYFREAGVASVWQEFSPQPSFGGIGDSVYSSTVHGLPGGGIIVAWDGDGGTKYCHFDSVTSTWSYHDSPTPGVTRRHGFVVSDTCVFCMGSLIEGVDYWDGATWTQLPLEEATGEQIAATSATNVWVATNLYHLEGSIWVDHVAEAKVALGFGNAMNFLCCWAMGGSVYFGALNYDDSTIWMFKNTGGVWAMVGSPFPGYLIRGIWGTDEAHLWILVADYDSGADSVIRYDPGTGTWITESIMESYSSPSGIPIFGISDDEVWVNTVTGYE